jgi:hypothetical protein
MPATPQLAAIVGPAGRVMVVAAAAVIITTLVAD